MMRDEDNIEGGNLDLLLSDMMLADRSGLELATTYSIVRKHDGHITVESELGVGTTFHIYLPAAANEIEIKTDLEDRPVVARSKNLSMCCKR